jgi:4-amino-4-deoxy-L-arabinose transferase-like glycosyltransferase
MLSLASTTILPGWVVLPVAAVTMLVVAGHILATHASDLPTRRRRLRVANGLLMLFVTALLAYALGVAAVVEDPATRPHETREFVIVWMMIIGLLGVVVAFAGADAIATIAHGLGVRRQFRRQMRGGLTHDLSARRAGTPSPQEPTRAAR